MLFCYYYSCPHYVKPVGVGVKEEQTEGSNDILNTTPRNPNHEPPAFCVLLSHNNLSTKSNSKYFSSYDWAKLWYCSVMYLGIAGKFMAFASASEQQQYCELLQNDSLHKQYF